jgi:hypothetical protein
MYTKGRHTNMEWNILFVCGRICLLVQIWSAHGLHPADVEQTTRFTEVNRMCVCVCVTHSGPSSAGNLQTSTSTGSMYRNDKQKQTPKHFSKKLTMHHTDIKIGRETVCPGGGGGWGEEALGQKIRDIYLTCNSKYSTCTQHGWDTRFGRSLWYGKAIFSNGLQ